MRPRLALVAVALLLTSCGGDKQPAAAKPKATVDTSIAPPPPTDIKTFGGKNLTEADTKRFARSLTEALRSKDERAFTKLLDPRRRALVAQQRAWFRNVERVPMTSKAVYVVGNRTNIDSSGKRLLTADLGFSHQIRGVDDKPVAEWYRYGFRKRGRRLLVASVTGAAPDGDSAVKYSRYYRQAWDDPGMAVVEGARSLVLGPGADRATLSRIAAAADGAVAAELSAFRRLGLALPRRARTSKYAFTLQSPAVRDLFDYFGGQVKRTEADFGGFAAPIYATDHVTGEVLNGRGAVTTRIVLARSQYGADLGTVIRHELVHGLLATFGPGFGVPTWVVEGAAVYLSDAPASELAGRRQDGLAQLGAAGRMPSNAGFYQGDNTVVARHYGAGYLGIAYLAHRYGRAGLARGLAALYRGDTNVTRFRGGLGEKAFGAAVRRWAS